MKKQQNKTKQETKKHELLRVVITDANTGEVLQDEKSTLFAGVIGQEKGCKTVIVGGGDLIHYLYVAHKLGVTEETMMKEIFSRNLESKEGEQK